MIDQYFRYPLFTSGVHTPGQHVELNWPQVSLLELVRDGVRVLSAKKANLIRYLQGTIQFVSNANR